jgi:transposase InsO family protein
MSETMQAKMVSDALLMALWRRGKPSSLMHHSDQGSQRRGLPSSCSTSRKPVMLPPKNEGSRCVSWKYTRPPG